MTPEETDAAYARALASAGETVVFRRYSGTGESRTHTDSPSIPCRVMGYSPEELVGNVQQGDRKVIIIASASLSPFTGPIKKGDKAVVRGKELNIEAVDDNTRRLAGTLIAYECQVRG